MEIKLSGDNFDSEVTKFKGKVLVDFWAPWCAPCRIMGPVLEEFAKDLPANVKVGKLNVDEHPQIAQRFSIMSIPTIIVFDNGKVLKQAVGVQSKEALQELIG